MSQRQLRQHWKRWSVLSVLLVCSLLLVVEFSSEVMAQTTNSGRGSNADRTGDVFVIAGQVTSGTYGLFLVDSKNETICVYQYLPHTKKLKLVAARTYRFDTQLDDYNCDAPSPADVKKLVSQQKPLGR
ncbi:MAG: hypothetical protein HN909_06120 [Phycisphaerales bacterium]|nr:hypothetical protein [Phycisphaerales bacterium]MBT7171329.1 hypothetical protein [Phycisphaerales bacterium]